MISSGLKTLKLIKTGNRRGVRLSNMYKRKPCHVTLAIRWPHETLGWYQGE